MFFQSLAIVAAIVTASAWLSSITSLDTSRVLAGEVWRIFSGHLSHLTWEQFAVDAPVFVMVYLTYERKAGPLTSIRLCLFSACCVSAAVIVAGRHEIYGGLSGLSCAALSALLFGGVLARPRQVALYALGSLYCVYLTHPGVSTVVVNVAGEAHVAGALSGVLFVVIQEGVRKFRKVPTIPRVDVSPLQQA